MVDEEEDGIKWPEWISGDDRRLLTTYGGGSKRQRGLDDSISCGGCNSRQDQ
ncbi:hypothetical protein SESBI_02795 [Sesbania bispinosa]|nr:hypothetical protein SESBI_02795 [Sesbania bispinosa]